ALSSRRSDESNLVALMKIARKENIACLKVVMPYSLESEQIQLIQDKGNVKIVVIPNEDILIAEFH
ncbi:transporter, partial [Vibrio alfacsensis]